MSESDASRTDRLVYLDAGFISAIFEEKTGEAAPAQLTRVDGMKAGATVPFFSAGLHTQETRTYNVSAREMLRRLADELLTYPQFDPESFENYRGTAISWLLGKLTISEWRITGGKKDTSVEHFELLQGGNRIALLLNGAYLAAGFDSILSMSDALKVNIAIPVRVLARVMWYAENPSTYVACPFVIYEVTPSRVETAGG